LPRKPQRLPRAVLTAHEAEFILAVPDLETPEGLRDRALMEVMYATGVRRSEVAYLILDEVDVERGSLTARPSTPTSFRASRRRTTLASCARSSTC